MPTTDQKRQALADGFAAILADGTIGSRQRAIALGGLFWRHQSTILAALRTTDPTSPSGGDGGAEANDQVVIKRKGRREYYRYPGRGIATTLNGAYKYSRQRAEKALTKYRDWDDFEILTVAEALEAEALPLPQDQAPRQGGEV